MHNQRMPQPQVIRADVRFDALVKKQMGEYQHLISSHHKEMQELRNLIKIAMERFDALYERCEVDMKDIALGLNGQIIFLKEKVAASEAKIADQKQNIESLHQQLNEFHETYASKKSMEKVKGDFELAIKANTISHINSFQDFQREFQGLFNVIKNDLLNLRVFLNEKTTEIAVKGEENFSQARLDKEGIERELLRYKKAVFYIEKKIENIYTLIERINKRGDSCLKQE